MPKKKTGGAKAKAKAQKVQRKHEKKKNKVKIDKTFGLKNKGGRRNRQFVANAGNNMNAEELRKKKERYVSLSPSKTNQGLSPPP